MKKLFAIFLFCAITCIDGYAESNDVSGDLPPIKARPDMVILVPNAGVVMVYRDKYGTIINEEYYSVRVHDTGIGICDDLGKNDTWLFTGGGYLLHKETKLPIGLEPYWRYVRKDKYGNILPEPSILHNEKSTMPKN